jgi:hypothetical protein
VAESHPAVVGPDRLVAGEALVAVADHEADEHAGGDDRGDEADREDGDGDARRVLELTMSVPSPDVDLLL